MLMCTANTGLAPHVYQLKSNKSTGRICVNTVVVVVLVYILFVKSIMLAVIKHDNY